MVILVFVMVMLVLSRIAVTGWREALLRAGYYFRLWRNGGAVRAYGIIAIVHHLFYPHPEGTASQSGNAPLGVARSAGGGNHRRHEASAARQHLPALRVSTLLPANPLLPLSNLIRIHGFNCGLSAFPAQASACLQ